MSSEKLRNTLVVGGAVIGVIAGALQGQSLFVGALGGAFVGFLIDELFLD